MLEDLSSLVYSGATLDAMREVEGSPQESWPARQWILGKGRSDFLAIPVKNLNTRKH